MGYLAGTPVPDELAESGVHLHPIAHSGNYDPMLFLRLVRLIWRLRPDIVQTWLLQMDILGGLAASLTRTPWLLREPVSGLFWTGGLKTRLRRWIGSSRRCDRFQFGRWRRLLGRYQARGAALCDRKRCSRG